MKEHYITCITSVQGTNQSNVYPSVLLCIPSAEIFLLKKDSGERKEGRKGKKKGLGWRLDKGTRNVYTK